MNKKGFTLIEIIIVIVLIGLIGTVGIVTLNHSKKSDKELSDLTKKVYEAANVFISINKDENGRNYEYGINNGGKALQFSVKNLLDSGYIDESLVQTLEKKTNKNREQLYILASNSIKSSDSNECGTNLVNYTNNWTESNIPVYLCPYNPTKNVADDEEKNKENIRSLYEALLENPVIEYDSSKIDFKYSSSPTNGSGLYAMPDFYFFRGNISNNYVKFANKVWQIVNFDKNGVKLIYYGDNIYGISKSVNKFNGSANWYSDDEKYVGNAVTDYLPDDETNFYTPYGEGHECNENPSCKQNSYILVNKTTTDYEWNPTSKKYKLTGKVVTSLGDTKTNMNRLKIDRTKKGDYVYTCSYRFGTSSAKSYTDISECEKLIKIKVRYSNATCTSDVCNSNIDIFYLNRKPKISSAISSKLNNVLDDWLSETLTKNDYNYLSKSNKFCNSYDKKDGIYTYSCENGYNTDIYPVALINPDDARLSGIGNGDKAKYGGTRPDGSVPCYYTSQNINFLSNNREKGINLFEKQSDGKFYQARRIDLYSNNCKSYSSERVFEYVSNDKENFSSSSTPSQYNYDDDFYPSIFLDANVTVKGNGTEMYPYEIVEESE